MLRPEHYEAAARDPFGSPIVTADLGQLWDGLLGVDEGDLQALRSLVEAHNSLDAAAAAIRDAVASMSRPRSRRSLRAYLGGARR